MRENDVWEIVDSLTSNQRNRKPNIIDSKWVIKRKIDENGQEKFKARLVIREFKGAVHSKTQLWPILVGNINL